jgi:hypothetical protein
LGTDGQPLDDDHDGGDEVIIFNGEGVTAEWEYWDGGSKMFGQRYDAHLDCGEFGLRQHVYHVHFDEEAGTMQWVDHQGTQFSDAAMSVTGYVVHEWTYDPATGEVASQGLGADASFYPDGASGEFDGTTLVMPTTDGEAHFTAYKAATTRAVRMPKKKKMFGCC